MRCLSLAEGLTAAGHSVELMTAELEVDWLVRAVAASGIPVTSSGRDALVELEIEQHSPDWLVVDSYTIPSEQISRANQIVPVLAIIDGDARGIDASLFLDQNLGAKRPSNLPRPQAQTLLGADFALIRDAILRERREDPWKSRHEPPQVLCFLGGNDETGTGQLVAEGLMGIKDPFVLTFVAPYNQHEALSKILARHPEVSLLRPTPSLPALLSATDILICAAGTSTWEACALGIPSVVISVVGNQLSSMSHAVDEGLTLGFDANLDRDDVPRKTADAVSRLMREPQLRSHISTAAKAAFDGQGKHRVTMELAARASALKGMHR